jgi:opacity protein-like surface antigen
MKCRNTGLIVAVLVMLAAGWFGRAAAESETTLPDWVKDHLEIGTRVTYFMLHDDRRDYDGGNRFFGSINNLDVDQQYLPVKLFVAYKFNPYWGTELTVEQLDVETWSRRPDGDSWTDGTINLLGPIASVFGRYPNATIFTPYAGVGAGYFFADFDANPTWRHSGSIYQDFRVDDALGWIGYVGLMVNLNDRWEIDFLVRYMQMDVEGDHMTSRDDGRSYYTNPRDHFTFPMSNTSLGLGLRYGF